MHPWLGHYLVQWFFDAGMLFGYAGVFSYFFLAQKKHKLNADHEMVFLSTWGVFGRMREPASN